MINNLPAITEPDDEFTKIAITSVYDESDEQAVINFIRQEEIKELMRQVPDNLKYLDEHALMKKSRHRLSPIRLGQIDELLRTQFWMEYNRVRHSAEGQRSFINMSNVYLGICTKDHFFKSHVKIPIKLAYMLTPCLAYEHKLNYMASRVFGVWEEILDADPIEKETGDVNAQILSAKSKVTEMIMDRRYGRAITRSANIEARLSEETSDKVFAFLSDNPKISANDALKRMEELQKKLTASSPVIEAEVESDDSSDS